MTVQELIDKLSAVEDKTVEVCVMADKTFIAMQMKDKAICFACYDVTEDDDFVQIIAE